MSPVSKFYHPVIARFISEDTYRGNPNDPLSLNLYTYCHNEPLQYDDPNGHFAQFIVGGLVGAAVGAVGNIGYQVFGQHKKLRQINWRSVGKSALEGGIAGALFAESFGASAVGGAILKQGGKYLAKRSVGSIMGRAALAQAAGNSTAQAVFDKQINLKEVAQSSLMAAGTAGLMSGLGNIKIGNILKPEVKIGNGIDVGVSEISTGVSEVKNGVNIELKYKEAWTAAQRAEADAKVNALTEAPTVKTAPNRSGTSASSRYKKANGSNSVPQGKDVDHTIDLQLGGADDILNMNPLDSSVNRSLGKQIQNKIKDYPVGTQFDEFTIQ